MRLAYLIAALLAIQVGIVATTMSITCDEVGHLGSGLYIWDYGRFDVYRVNPPLVRTLASAPMVFLNPTRDYQRYAAGPATRVEWRLGEDLITANSDWGWYVTFGRWAVLPLVLVGAWFVLRWSNELYAPHLDGSTVRPGDEGESKLRGRGPAAAKVSVCALISLALYCFCPNVVAWSGTFTPDAAAGAMGVAAGYSFWRWLRHPTWRNAGAAAVWLSLAELTKFTWIILFLLWPLLWVMWRMTERTIRSADAAVARQPSFLQLMTILLTTLYAINLGYGFEGSFTPVKDFVFVSRALAGKDSKTDDGPGGNRFKDSWIGEVPVPVPLDYLRGIDLQKVDFEVGKPSYLNGVWSDRGWWYYYLYAAALKIPLGTWLIGAIVLTNPRRWKRNSETTRQRLITWRDEIVLLAPAATLFVLVSSQTGFSRYFRYVLPCLPFVYVWLGQAGSWFTCHLEGRSWRAWGVGAALIWSIVSSLSIFPHSMSYFNELAGGPKHGHYHLIDANIDWGQDMYRLRNWLRDHPEASSVSTAPLTFVKLSHYDILAKTPYDSPMPGWYAMSIHRIHDQDDRYKFFLHYDPVAMAGYSTYIYHVTPAAANRVLKELGRPESAFGEELP